MKTIPSGSLIALDSMIFIYLFESDKRYEKVITPLFEKIEIGKLKAVTSTISLIEALSAPKLASEPEKIIAFKRFFYETPNLTIFDVDKEIAIEASKIRRERLFLRTPDSIQIATAIVGKAEYFLTNDGRISKLANLPVKIVSLTDLN